MNKIEVYETSDGSLFKSEKDALAREVYLKKVAINNAVTHYIGSKFHILDTYLRLKVEYSNTNISNPFVEILVKDTDKFKDLIEFVDNQKKSI